MTTIRAVRISNVGACRVRIGSNQPLVAAGGGTGASGARLSGERRAASERHSRRAVSQDADRPKGLYYYCEVRLKADTTDPTGLKACTTPANVGLKPDATVA